MNAEKPRQYQDAPDLIRRFVPTPFRATLRIGIAEVLVESNDPAMIEVLAGIESASSLWPHSFRWKIVYDKDAPSELSDAMSISCGQVVVVSMGTACLIGVDQARNELVGFLGCTADSPAFRDTIVPVLVGLTRDALATRCAAKIGKAQTTMVGDGHD